MQSPSDIMIKLYKAFILPHFEYASPLFIGLSKGLSTKLESTNAFALRTLLNYSKSTAYKDLLKTVHIKSLEHRRIEQALILVYNSIYNQAPNYIRVLRSNGYSLRGHLKVVLPRPTSSYMQHSFTYQAGKQWNNLPDKMRMSESLSIFSCLHRMTATVYFVNRQSDYQYFLFLNYYYFLVDLIFLFLIFIYHLYM